MKYILILLVLTSFSALAETVNFGGTQSSTCTLVKNSDGTLTFTSAVAFATQSGNEGQVTVTNNDAGAFNVFSTVPSSWGLKPADYVGTTTFSSSFDLAGVNSATDSNGTLLTNAGIDTMDVVVDGTSDSEFTAGAYGAQVVITCTPL